MTDDWPDSHEFWREKRVTVAGGVDFALAFVVLLGMMLFYNIVPTAAVVWLPLLLLLALVTALGVGLWLTAMNVQFRDVRYAVPFLVQAWMVATPSLRTPILD
jgi:lipopolysaccharide transport system permease protein